MTWARLRADSRRLVRLGSDGSRLETPELPVRVVADRRIGGAMCGNDLAWVRAGRFSDGRHREVAFMLWTTPSIGATASIYRVDGGRFRSLASFAGDRVVLARGTVVV